MHISGELVVHVEGEFVAVQAAKELITLFALELHVRDVVLAAESLYGLIFNVAELFACHLIKPHIRNFTTSKVLVEVTHHLIKCLIFIKVAKRKYWKSLLLQ